MPNVDVQLLLTFRAAPLAEHLGSSAQSVYSSPIYCRSQAFTYGERCTILSYDDQTKGSAVLFPKRNSYPSDEGANFNLNIDTKFMSNLSRIHSKADFIGTLNPRAWDAVHPHTPFVFSNAFVELLIADVVKEVATAIPDRTLGKEALKLSQRMAAQAASSMTASWEPGDEICPPWPWPWPGPWLAWAEPHPDPWKGILSAEQIGLAYVLARLSGLTTSQEFNASLKSMATELVRGVAGKVADDFEQCGTVPRKPFPKPKGDLAR